MKAANERKIITLQDQLTLVRRTMMVRDELKHIRLQREQAKCKHKCIRKKASERLSSLSAEVKEKMKQKEMIHIYQQAMTESYLDGFPNPSILQQQTTLLKCLHLTEIFRNQWEILFNQLIRSTQDEMQKVSMLKGAKIARNHVQVPPPNQSSRLKVPEEEDQWTIIFTFFSHEIGSVNVSLPKKPKMMMGTMQKAIKC